MAINFTGEEKIDLLLKKVAYGVSKTGTSNTKGPNGESFTSFKAIAPQHVWKEANTTNITASPPATSTAYIGVYGLDGGDTDFTSTGSKIAPKKATAVANAQQMPDFSDFKRAWNTGVTNWLGPAFGSAYAVKVYVGGASWDGATSTMSSNGITEIIFGDDPSRDWFFDYEAGILYWTNEQGSDSGNNGNYDDSVDFDNPDAAYINDGDVVYIGGWTYIGETGVGGDGISLGTDFDAFASLTSNVLEFDDQSGNVVLASPSDGSGGAVSFRALVAADISDVTLSGDNTGDQTITLTGDVTGTGTGSFATTIADEAVTLAKMAHMATNSFLGRDTDGDGDVEVLSASAVRGILNVEDGADVTDAANVAAAGAVLTSGDQTVAGIKTFSSTIVGSINGNAGTVTNGVYTTSSVTALSDVTNAGSGAIITSDERTKLNGIEESADVTDATNVAAAGAVMNTGDETIAGTKTFSSNIVGNLTGNVTGTVSDISNHDTGDLTEGTNLYYTDARVRAAVSATDAGGDGSFNYSSATGAFTYTGPSAAETRAHFSGGTGVTITDGAVAIGQAVGTGDSPTFAGLTAGNTFINGNLTVDGNVIQKNTSTMRVEDNLIELGVPLDNADTDSVLLTANYTANALIGLEVILQTDNESTVGITNKAALVYDHLTASSTTKDKWKFGYDSAGSVVYDNVVSLKFDVTTNNLGTESAADNDVTNLLGTDGISNDTNVRSVAAVSKCTIDISTETTDGDDNFAPVTAASNGYVIKHDLNTESVFVMAMKTHQAGASGTGGAATELTYPDQIFCRYRVIDANTVFVKVGITIENEKYDIIVIG